MYDDQKGATGPRLAVVKGALTLEGGVSGKMYDTLATLPGKRRRVDNVLYIQATEDNLFHILARHPEINRDNKVAALIENFEEIRRKKQIEAERQRRDAVLETENFPFKSEPYMHQKEAFSRFCRAEYFALFFEMGAGKTKCLLDIAAYKYSIGEIDTLVIIAPNGVHRQWVTEQLGDHLPDFTHYKGYFHTSSKRKKNRDNFNEVYDYEEGLRVFTFNIESLASETGKKTLSHVMDSSGKVMLVVDESTKIKSHRAKRTQFILKAGEKAVCRAILDGTPITQGVQDLFSPCLFLSEKVLGISNYYVFQNRYLVMGGYEGRQILRYKNVEEIQERVDAISMRVLKEDCLDLPDKIFIDREVEPSDEQWRIYNEIKEDFLTVMEDGTEITVTEAMTRVMKMQQVLCGHIKDGEGRTIRIDDSRAREVVEIMNEGAGKTIVWCRFTEDTNIIMQLLTEAKIGHVRYTGQENADEKRAAIEKFRNDPDCLVFIANPMAAGTGLNLTVANTAIWYSPSFSLGDYLQANDRCHRIGQHFPVTYIHLKAPKTIDGKILNALHRKQDVARTVMDIREMFL